MLNKGRKKLEKMIIHMRKSTSNILSSTGEQSRGPAGFAAIWKSKPMILEDAHGNFLAIPLEVVVSWEVSFGLEHLTGRRSIL